MLRIARARRAGRPRPRRFADRVADRDRGDAGRGRPPGRDAGVPRCRSWTGSAVPAVVPCARGARTNAELSRKQKIYTCRYLH